MPTYDYRCAVCETEASVFQTMREYSEAPIVPQCRHGNMERKLSVVPGLSGLANALAGDRHYDGLRASDGTDISSRTKHRQYMAQKGLTTADDFSNTWKQAAKEKAEYRSATKQDKETREIVARQVYSQTT